MQVAELASQLASASAGAGQVPELQRRLEGAQQAAAEARAKLAQAEEASDVAQGELIGLRMRVEELEGRLAKVGGMRVEPGFREAQGMA